MGSSQLTVGSARLGRRGVWRWRRVRIAVAAIAVVFSLSRPTGAQPPKEVRRILVLNEVGISYPGITIINGGIQAALNDAPYRLEFHSEYMDTGLFPDPSDQQKFRDFFLQKYQNRKPGEVFDWFRPRIFVEGLCGFSRNNKVSSKRDRLSL